MTCPTPWKITYPTRDDARRDSRSHKQCSTKGQLRPYSCVCGFWHLTSMPPAAVRALRKRMRDAA